MVTRRGLPADAARWAHFGATPQDVLVTALMVVLRRVLVVDALAAELGLDAPVLPGTPTAAEWARFPLR